MSAEQEEHPETKREARGSPRRRIALFSITIFLLAAIAATLVLLLLDRTKPVPNVMGLTRVVAEQKIKAAGLKASFAYKYPHSTGKEKVIEQTPSAGKRDKNVHTIKVVLTDREMEAAVQQASQAIGQANAALQEAQALGIDTADLAQPMQNAQAKLDGAKSAGDCVGQSDSACYWANIVLNAINTKKQAYAVQQERNNQIAACRAAMYAAARESSASNLSISIDSISMNADCTYATAAVHGTFTSGPRSGTNVETAKIIAERQGDRWVVLDFGTGI